MDTRERAELLDFYRNHLFGCILPFWLNRSIDRENGGFYNCFDNADAKLVSTDKFTWSQGRFVWILSRLACTEIDGIPGEEREKYLRLAKSGADFILDNCIMANGRCAFLTDEKGRIKEQEPGKGYDTSIYADAFAVLGLSGYGMASGEDIYTESALSLYENMTERLGSGDYRTYPYPIPKGYRCHGIPMTMLHVSQMLYHALKKTGHARQDYVREKSDRYRAEILAFIVDGMLMEFINKDDIPGERLIDSYVNPGHTLEEIWFVMHHAMERGDSHEIGHLLVPLAKTAHRAGWDKEHGGLLLYVGRRGGKPAGIKTGGEAAVMEEKLENFWDCKLWWVHSEALYTYLLLHELTGDPELKDLHDRVREYTFRTFPNPDRNVGEWIQIRDRRGTPVESVVALPVKDPFHIARNLILIAELLSLKKGRKG